MIATLVLAALPLTLPAEALTTPRPLSEAVTALQEPDSDLAARVAALEAKVKEHERIAEEAVPCMVQGFYLAAADGLTTGGALTTCEACQEANPLGMDVEARIALKLAQIGTHTWACYEQAKKSTKAVGALKWATRLLYYPIIVNNLYAWITGKPLIRWGVEEAPQP